MQRLGLLVPAYFSPEQNGSDWQRLAQAAGRAPLAVVANVNSGPGAASDWSSAWTNAFAAVQAGGGRVIGYVPTDGGTRALSAVLSDIQTWWARYPRLDGIFIDDMAQSATPAALSYYGSIARNIRASHPQALIVANPGGVFDQAFLQNDTADVYVRAENRASTVDAQKPPSWMTQALRSRFAQIKWGAANDASEVRFAAAQPATGWIYSTTLGWQNPYSALPSDFEQEVQAVAGIDQGTLGASLAAMCFGVGDRLNWMQTQTTYVSTSDLLSQIGFPKENQLLATWLESNWNTSYFNGLQSWMDKGFVPVIVYYYEGDLAQYGQNAWTQVQATQTQWLADAQRLGQFLATLRGTALVVIQPEWNIPTLQDNAQFGALLGQVAQTIRQAALGSGNPGLRLRIGTAVGDFGNYTLVQDPYWASFKPAMTAALAQLDFTGFQEMRASVHLNASGQLQTYTAAQEGLPTLAQRTVALAQYLNGTYGKPVLIPYVEIASYTPSGSTENWSQLSAQAYAAILAQRSALQAAGVFGVGAMALFDDLSHNNSGTDYFGPASLTYGLVQSNGESGSPLIGQPPYTVKPSGQAWTTGTSAAQSGGAVCAIP